MENERDDFDGKQKRGNGQDDLENSGIPVNEMDFDPGQPILEPYRGPEGLGTYDGGMIQEEQQERKEPKENFSYEPVLAPYRGPEGLGTYDGGMIREDEESSKEESFSRAPIPTTYRGPEGLGTYDAGLIKEEPEELVFSDGQRVPDLYEASKEPVYSDGLEAGNGNASGASGFFQGSADLSGREEADSRNTEEEKILEALRMMEAMESHTEEGAEEQPEAGAYGDTFSEGEENISRSFDTGYPETEEASERGGYEAVQSVEGKQKERQVTEADETAGMSVEGNRRKEELEETSQKEASEDVFFAGKERIPGSSDTEYPETEVFSERNEYRAALSTEEGGQEDGEVTGFDQSDLREAEEALVGAEERPEAGAFVEAFSAGNEGLLAEAVENEPNEVTAAKPDKTEYQEAEASAAEQDKVEAQETESETATGDVATGNTEKQASFEENTAGQPEMAEASEMESAETENQETKEDASSKDDKLQKGSKLKKGVFAKKEKTQKPAKEKTPKEKKENRVSFLFSNRDKKAKKAQKKLIAKKKKASSNYIFEQKKRKVNISPKDLKLLILFAALAIFFCTYFFYYTNKVKELEQTEVANGEIRTRITELLNRVAQAEGLKAETASVYEGMKGKLNEFPSDVRTEDLIYFLDQMEKDGETELEISSESLGEREIFYTTDVVASEEPAEEPVEEDLILDFSDGSYTDRAAIYGTGNTQNVEGPAEKEAGEQAETPELSEEESQDALEQLQQMEEQMLSEEEKSGEEGELNVYGPYEGYRRVSSISFQTTYDGLKNLIRKINENENKMRIQTLGASFDESTGILAGSMTLSFYAIGGNGKEYAVPDIQGIKIGTKNIFATVKKEKKVVSEKTSGRRSRSAKKTRSR